MSAADQIAKLDRFIAKRGEEVTLQRLAGTIPNQTLTSLPLGAVVRPVGVREIVGNVKSTDQKVVMSPTTMTWAEIKTTDKLLVAGKVYTIVEALPTRLSGIIVRYDLRITG